MRFESILLCAVMAVSFLAACTPRIGMDSSVSSTPPALSSDAPSVPFESESSTGPAEAIDAPVAELKIPGEIMVYKLLQDAGIFEPYKVLAGKDEVTLLDIAAAVENQLDVSIPIKKITQQKGMVVVDIAESFIDTYPKAEVYQILTTLAATLQQNHRSFEWIQYQLDGTVGVFGEQYEIPPLKLLGGSAEEFAAIRAKVPYEGLQERYSVEDIILDTDGTGKKLANYLAILRLVDEDISSLAEFDNEKALETAIFATKWYTSNPDYGENYAPELKPMEAPASEALGFYEDWFWLKEHVEQSAKQLFGGDFVLKHQDIGKYRYLDAVGVYTPPHMGGGYGVIPVIFGYEDLGDRYKIQLAYILMSEGGYSDPDSGDFIDYENLKQYAQTKSKRREAVVRKMEDGHLVLVSQKYL